MKAISMTEQTMKRHKKIHSLNFFCIFDRYFGLLERTPGLTLAQNSAEDMWRATSCCFCFGYFSNTHLLLAYKLISCCWSLFSCYCPMLTVYPDIKCRNPTCLKYV